MPSPCARSICTAPVPSTELLGDGEAHGSDVGEGSIQSNGEGNSSEVVDSQAVRVPPGH